MTGLACGAYVRMAYSSYLPTYSCSTLNLLILLNRSPPLAAVDEALPFGAKVSFVEFLRSLANNSRVNFAVGRCIYMTVSSSCIYGGLANPVIVL